MGTEFNDFEQYVLTYTNYDLLGGSLSADVYTADQAMRFPADNGADRQDPLIAPIGTAGRSVRDVLGEGRRCARRGRAPISSRPDSSCTSAWTS